MIDSAFIGLKKKVFFLLILELFLTQSCKKREEQLLPLGYYEFESIGKYTFEGEVYETIWSTSQFILNYSDQTHLSFNFFAFDMNHDTVFLPTSLIEVMPSNEIGGYFYTTIHPADKMRIISGEIHNSENVNTYIRGVYQSEAKHQSEPWEFQDVTITADFTIKRVE